jgi:hypothetical protein
MSRILKSNPKIVTKTALVPIVFASVVAVCLMSLMQFSRECKLETPSTGTATTSKLETTSPLSLSSYIYQYYYNTEYVPSSFESYVHQNADDLGLKHTSFEPSGCYLWGYDDATQANSGSPLPTEEEKEKLKRVPTDIRQQYLDHNEQMKKYQAYISNEFQLKLPPYVVVNAKNGETSSAATTTTTSEKQYSDVRHALRYYNHSLVCDALQVPWGGSTLNSHSTTTLLSHIEHAGGGKSDKQFLEPLLPQLRHADLCISKPAHLLDMHYMVHDFRYICNTMTPHTRTIFVDMGGSLLFHGGNNPAIVLADLYKQFGIRFDHVYAYEMTSFTPDQTKSIFESLIPDMWLTSYHWINTGVDSTVNANLNPFTMIKEHFLPEDFVVVKLDIDTPSVELPLAQELLNDPILHTLVDQFYFEYHVKLKELTEWGGVTEGSIYDAIHLMTQLREKGIASHFWV